MSLSRSDVIHRVLTNTVYYIEEHVMEKDMEGPDARFGGEDPPEMDVYLFVWDRFRMIAKDFILQLESNDSNVLTSDDRTRRDGEWTFLLRCGAVAGDVLKERVLVDKLCLECHGTVVVVICTVCM
jgi:hypothetical protein